MGSAVSVVDVHKSFRIFHDRHQSLKGTILSGGRRSRYEEFQALDGVTFDIEAGTTFGLIGENGSGKSTLLKCMARILRPDKGHIETNGKVSALLELGAGFHPELSGRDNVFLNGSILGMSSRQMEDRFDDIVAFAGLERFIDTPVKNYSSGMFVRLGFSVAIHVEPDILLVDEVLAVGDEQFQRKCGEKFAELKRKGVTVVVVSHGLGALRDMCDRIAWLEHGQLRHIGPPGETVDEYLGEVRHQRRAEHVAAEQTQWHRAAGESVLRDCVLLDGAGEPTDEIVCGEPCTLRISYDAGQLPEPVHMAIGLYRNDGVRMASINNAAAAVTDQDGVLTFECHIPRLALLPGSYEVAVALHDPPNLVEYDRQQPVVRFEVAPGQWNEHFGMVLLGAEWRRADQR